MAGYSLGQMLRFMNPRRKSRVSVVRDRLVREGHHVNYFVWNNKIASLNTKQKSLSVSDAGWQTKLTKDRLNQILPQGRIFQRKHQWYVGLPSGKEIPWRGGFRFNLKKLGY